MSRQKLLDSLATIDSEQRNSQVVEMVADTVSDGLVAFGFSERRRQRLEMSLRACDSLMDYSIGNGRTLSDSGDGMNFLVSQLAYVEATMVERMYQPAQFRDFLPVRSEAGAWAESIRYQLIDYSGHAKLINARSSGDIPRASVAHGFVEQGIVTPAIGYDYTVVELAQSAYLRQPLDVSRAKAAREGCERTFNQIALYGREYGPQTVDGVAQAAAPAIFPGLFNFQTTKTDGSQFTMNSITIPRGLWNTNPTTAAAGTATPQYILEDVNALLNAAWVNSGYNVWPDTILLPPSVQSALDQPINAIGGDSVRTWLIKNNRATQETGGRVTPRFLSAVGLDDVSVFTSKASGTRRMIAYNSSPDNIAFWVPQNLIFLPPQYERLSISVEGYARCSAGIQLRQPTTAIFADGL